MYSNKIPYIDFVIWRANYIKSKRWINENIVEAFKKDFPNVAVDTHTKREGELVKLICN